VFVNVVNLGQRPITLTHAWFATEPELHILNDQRPLPKTLQPDEPWETWTPLSAFGSRLDGMDEQHILRAARLRLSTGRVVKARPNRGVPAVGTVPGG
jgi:hypothetical protein